MPPVWPPPSISQQEHARNVPGVQVAAGRVGGGDGATDECQHPEHEPRRRTGSGP